MKLFSIKTGFSIAAILLLLVLVAWMAGMFSSKIPPGSEPEALLSEGKTISVLRRDELIYEQVSASIEAKQATIISSRILARIDRVHVRAGDMVERGQLLVELEQADLQSRVSQAESAVASVTARLTQARQSLGRIKGLVKQGVMAQADLDQARANHDSLVADLASADQFLNESTAALGFAQVVAPIDGRIVDRFAEPGDTAQPGVPLVSLYNPLTLRVEANVREQLAVLLELEQEIEVTVPALDTTLMSYIEERVPAGNSGSRSFMIKSRLAYDARLLPGMYAQLHIPAGIESLLLIPADRVAAVGQLDMVWVLNQGVVERRLVRLGKRRENNSIEVISGLREGEQLLPLPGQVR